MNLQSERLWFIGGEALFVLLGCHWVYGGFTHAQTYGLQSVFFLTVAVLIPVTVGMGLIVIRSLNSMKSTGILPDRKRLARGPYYVHYWILLLGAAALISMIVFHIERFGSLEAWEAWSLNPHQRTAASIATTILQAATGVAWIVVPGSELVWWLWRGKHTNRAASG